MARSGGLETESGHKLTHIKAGSFLSSVYIRQANLSFASEINADVMVRPQTATDTIPPF
jgi:hypothetical protein